MPAALNGQLVPGSVGQYRVRIRQQQAYLPGDVDRYRFTAHKGQHLVASVSARELIPYLPDAVPGWLQAVLALYDSDGNEVAYNDDFRFHADSYISATLPADGIYYIFLGDAQHKGGTEYGYRLRISAPRPDFDLRVVPSAVNAIVGPTVPITVHALRKDGFSGEITLALEDAPKGFVLSGGLVPAGQDKVQLTLTVPPIAVKEPISFKLEGRAVIQEKEIVRLAVPADDMMQAFAYRHLVPAKELQVSSTGRGPSQAALKILNDRPLKIPLGGTVRVQIRMPALGLVEKIKFGLSEPPEGISITDSSLTKQGAEFVLQSDAAKVKPGLNGNLIVSVSGERTPPAKNNSAAARPQRIPLGTLPAIAFEIVKP